jgi:hypothetical protein
MRSVKLVPISSSRRWNVRSLTPISPARILARACLLGRQLNDPTLQPLQEIGLVCAARRQDHFGMFFQQREQFVI